jgi:hypothetical protein
MPAIRRLILLLVALLAIDCSRGCDDRSTTTTTTPAASATTTSQPTTRRVVFTGKTPFEGVIRTTHRLAGLPIRHVTYTISPRRIRREQVEQSAVLTSKLTGDADLQGMIVDLEKREVLIYRKYLSKKLAITLTFEEFDERANSIYIEGLYATDQYRFLAYEPDKYTITNTPDAVTIDGLSCDRLIIDPFAIIVDHCRAIVVDRELLSRIEPRLPKEVTGFPLRIQRATAQHDVTTIGSAAHGSLPRTAEVVDRALRATTRAATRAATLVDESMEFTDIAEGSVEGSSFDLPAGFTMLSDYAKFTRETTPSGGGFDFD